MGEQCVIRDQAWLLIECEVVAQLRARGVPTQSWRQRVDQITGPPVHTITRLAPMDFLGCLWGVRAPQSSEDTMRALRQHERSTLSWSLARVRLSLPPPSTWCDVCNRNF